MLRSTQYELRLLIMLGAYQQPVAGIIPTREASGPLCLYFIYRLPWLVTLLTRCGEAFAQKGLHVLEGRSDSVVKITVGSVDVGFEIVLANLLPSRVVFPNVG